MERLIHATFFNLMFLIMSAMILLNIETTQQYIFKLGAFRCGLIGAGLGLLGGAFFYWYIGE